jgi:hypothetical protein
MEYVRCFAIDASSLSDRSECLESNLILDQREQEKEATFHDSGRDFILGQAGSSHPDID